MSQLAPRLEALLTDLLRALPEIEAAALVTVDGLPMASALPAGMNEDRVAAMSAALLSLGERAADGLGRGGLAQVSIEGEDGSVHLLAAGEEAVLVAVASTGAKAGLVLYELRRTAADLGAELVSSAERAEPRPEIGSEDLGALAGLAAEVPIRAASPPAPRQAPVSPSYEPRLPGVGTALAGLEPPCPVMPRQSPDEHRAEPDAPPSTSWPSWS